MHFNDFSIHALPIVYSFSQQENSAKYDVMLTPTAWFHGQIYEHNEHCLQVVQGYQARISILFQSEHQLGNNATSLY
jgi:hypothetical protein